MWTHYTFLGETILKKENKSLKHFVLFLLVLTDHVKNILKKQNIELLIPISFNFIKNIP